MFNIIPVMPFRANRIYLIEDIGAQRVAPATRRLRALQISGQAIAERSHRGGWRSSARPARGPTPLEGQALLAPVGCRSSHPSSVVCLLLFVLGLHGLAGNGGMCKGLARDSLGSSGGFRRSP